MRNLSDLLNEIQSCSACSLMQENLNLDIPYVPIIPKPKAKVVFIGRDPSPRTTSVTGMRGGKSVFVKEIFSIVDAANFSDEEIYITNICKCHWRTSKGMPIDCTELRSSKINDNVIEACKNQWFYKEMELLQPKLIISFGEELYDYLKENIVTPVNYPKKLSETKDKSKVDAELLFVRDGFFKIRINNINYNYAPLRHPGNSISLSISNPDDLRYKYYQESRNIVISFLKTLN